MASLATIGQLARVEGDVERATALTRRSATMAHDAGWAGSGQLHALLMLALERGDLDEAEQQGRAALVLERDQENRLWALYSVAGLAQVAHGAGELERAGVLWGAGEREAERLPRWPGERARVEEVRFWTKRIPGSRGPSSAVECSSSGMPSRSP